MSYVDPATQGTPTKGNPIATTWGQAVQTDIQLLHAQGSALVPYTPSWLTGTSIGNGSISGNYILLGPPGSSLSSPQYSVVLCQISLTTGSTTTYGTGQFQFSFPSIFSNSPYTFGVSKTLSSLQAVYTKSSTGVSSVGFGQVVGVLSPGVPFSCAVTLHGASTPLGSASGLATGDTIQISGYFVAEI